MGKKIIVNEKQLGVLFEELAGSEILRDQDKMTVPVRYPVNTQKVLIVKNFLDNNFQRESMDCIGDDGFPAQTFIVAMVANGNKLKDMYKEDVIDLLIEKYKNMFLNHDERQRFITQVFNDWYDNKIGTYGTLSKNYV